jgi:hypothetical protein
VATNQKSTIKSLNFKELADDMENNHVGNVTVLSFEQLINNLNGSRMEQLQNDNLPRFGGKNSPQGHMMEFDMDISQIPHE